MELDGYCEELKIAFEYNGIHHYKPHENNFRGGNAMFQRTIENDALKTKLCAERGVTLVVIPYWERNIEEFLNDYFAPTYMAI
jgi:hypothetical protein